MLRFRLRLTRLRVVKPISLLFRLLYFKSIFNLNLLNYQHTNMTKFSSVLISLALLFNGVSALAPSKVSKAKRPAFDPKRVAFNGMAAASLASALVVGPMADAVDMMTDAPSFGSSSLVAERVTREGLYREYDVDVGDQVFDDARSTYKIAKETKTKKGTCTFCHVLVDYNTP